MRNDNYMNDIINRVKRQKYLPAKIRVISLKVELNFMFELTSKIKPLALASGFFVLLSLKC